MVSLQLLLLWLVQLMHWSEQKRAELLRRTVMQAFREGYDVRKSEEMQ